MSENSDLKSGLVNELNDIIAFKLAERMRGFGKFGTLDLAKEIVVEFKERGVLEEAMIGYVNGIIQDLVKQY